MPATAASQTAVHDQPAAAASSQTPRTAARGRAQVAASYVGTFVAGVCVAAIPLLSLLKQIVEHRDELFAVADLVQRIGWPALISGVAIGWMHFERRAWRKDRADFRDEMAAERRASRAEIEALGAQTGGALREVAAALRESALVTRELLRRLGVRTAGPSSAESTGPQERIRPGVRERRATLENEVVNGG